jgi:hypothetical protein
MPDSSERSKTVRLLLMVLAFYTWEMSCFNPFSPSVIGPSVLKPIAPQVDPDSVLYNFKYAYENRDSVVYENCLDEDFVFTYWDQSDVQGIFETELLRSEDIRVTKVLFRFFEEITLYEWKVEIAPDSIGEETWKARKASYDLLIWDMDGDYNYQYLHASGYAEFLFRQSPKDNLWRIIRWIDRTI